MTTADIIITAAPADETSADMAAAIEPAAMAPACHVDMTSTEEDVPLHLGSLGLILHRDLTCAEYDQLFQTVTSMHCSASWLLGDTLAFGERRWGNQFVASRYEEAARRAGCSIGHLRNIVSVCRAIPQEKRHAGLSFSHHLEVRFATNDPERMEAILTAAEADGVSVKALRKTLRKQAGTTSPATPDNAEIGDEERPFGLTTLPEPAPAGAPPLWDIKNYHRWIAKQKPAQMTQEDAKKAVVDFAPILPFALAVLRRLRELGVDADQLRELAGDSAAGLLEGL